MNNNCLFFGFCFYLARLRCSNLSKIAGLRSGEASNRNSNSMWQVWTILFLLFTIQCVQIYTLETFADTSVSSSQFFCCSPHVQFWQAHLVEWRLHDGLQQFRLSSRFTAQRREYWFEFKYQNVHQIYFMNINAAQIWFPNLSSFIALSYSFFGIYRARKSSGNRRLMVGSTFTMIAVSFLISAYDSYVASLRNSQSNPVLQCGDSC